VIVVLTAMRSELRPFVRAAGLTRSDDGAVWSGTVGGHEVVATTMGVGMAGAAAAAEQALQRGDVERLLVVGIAGGIDQDLPIGHVVVPEVVIDGAGGAEHPTAPWGPVEPDGRLITYHDFQTDPELMARLQREGYAAIDMETAAVAAVCERHGCPHTAFRAISDDALGGTIDPQVAAMARPDGSPDLGAAVRYVLRRPWRVPYLVGLGRDSERAARAAADAAVAALRA